MRRLVTVLAAGVLVLAGCVGVTTEEDGSPPPVTTTIPAVEVGALLPITGALASYGETSEAALDEAVATVAAADGALELHVEDTGSDPATALARLQELHEQGVRVVVGPYSSAEVEHVLDFANENGILLLSPLSTAHSLAIEGDNLFRFTPDDVEEGFAVASLAWEDGVRTLVTVARDDLGNRGLVTATREAFETAGGTIVEGPVYGTEVTDFADEVTALEAALAEIPGDGSDVGIYLAGFAEVRDLLAAADASAALGAVPWYGSNSVALSRELLENDVAAAFAIAAGYPNPIMGLRDADEDRWGPVAEQVAAATGREPDAFALAAYDAAVSAYDALVAAGEGAEAAAVATELVAVTEATTGLTGPLLLNEAGDRALATFDFWAVCTPDDGGFSWQRVATFAREAGIERPQPAACTA